MEDNSSGKYLFILWKLPLAQRKQIRHFSFRDKKKKRETVPTVLRVKSSRHLENSYNLRCECAKSHVFTLLLEASHVAQSVKHLPTMQGTWVEFLGGEVPLEREMATHSGILAWRIP